MPRFAANLSMLFTELPFLDRFEAAAAVGFKGVEFLFPYAFDAGDIARRLTEHDLTLVLFNLPPGNWDAGERGIACLADRVGEFKSGVTEAARYARELGCRHIHAMAGIEPRGVAVSILRDTYVANVQYAAEELSADGIDVLIEPINTRDMPGYFLNGTEQALDLLALIGRGNVKLQYDCYHMHIMERDVATAIPRLIGSIGHVQIADVPGRHEPGTGEIDYAAVFRSLDQAGYTGWIGCEYRPQAATLAGLPWMKQFA